MRASGPNSEKIGTVLNGTPVNLGRQVGTYVEIFVDTSKCDVAHDVNAVAVRDSNAIVTAVQSTAMCGDTLKNFRLAIAIVPITAACS